MAVPKELAALAGEWSATSRLWLSPEEPARESASAATASLVANGKFLVLRYTWTEGGPQEGLIVLGIAADGARASASWVDSWHMGHAMMACEGSLQGDAVSVKGTYPAPPGPDWGWWIAIEPRGSDAFRFTMFNITPEGEEQPAVDAEYARRR